jgi:hypothetical protein
MSNCQLKWTRLRKAWTWIRSSAGLPPAPNKVEGENAVVEIAALDFRLPLSDVYARVTLLVGIVSHYLKRARCCGAAAVDAFLPFVPLGVAEAVNEFAGGEPAHLRDHHR